MIDENAINDDDTVKLILINPETNTPYDEDDPVILTQEEFRYFKETAEEKGMTFDEFFTYIIRLAIENLNKGDFPVANFGFNK